MKLSRICFAPLAILTACLLSFLIGYHVRSTFNVDSILKKYGVRSYVNKNVDKKEKRPPSGNNIVSILILGQSNAANHGELRYSTQLQAVNFHLGDYYMVSDPLLGASGNGGSVWSRFSDLVIREGIYDGVVLSILSIQGTSTHDWLTNRGIDRELVDLTSNIKESDLKIDYIFWVQGESDNIAGTSKLEYANNLRRIVNKVKTLGINVPFVIAKSTLCGKFLANQGIHDAISEIASHDENIFIGPNLDAISRKYRYDGCHLSEEGLWQAAYLWKIWVINHQK